MSRVCETGALKFGKGGDGITEDLGSWSAVVGVEIALFGVLQGVVFLQRTATSFQNPGFKVSRSIIACAPHFLYTPNEGSRCKPKRLRFGLSASKLSSKIFSYVAGSCREVKCRVSDSNTVLTLSATASSDVHEQPTLDPRSTHFKHQPSGITGTHAHSTTTVDLCRPPISSPPKLLSLIVNYNNVQFKDRLQLMLECLSSTPAHSALQTLVPGNRHILVYGFKLRYT
ncbi:hypothetical protein B0H34DRAFT_671520 [Crassisporium funariophilum]|nr:hypothetical protein B0H34DRAFT_671520 [Crassisporium funariophilum]